MLQILCWCLLRFFCGSSSHPVQHDLPRHRDDGPVRGCSCSIRICRHIAVRRRHQRQLRRPAVRGSARHLCRRSAVWVFLEELKRRGTTTLVESSWESFCCRPNASDSLRWTGALCVRPVEPNTGAHARVRTMNVTADFTFPATTMCTFVVFLLVYTQLTSPLTRASRATSRSRPPLRPLCFLRATTCVKTRAWQTEPARAPQV
jgi:hypothetical protein